jgi:hypothetical protein
MAGYNLLGLDVKGHREILGRWIGEGGEGTNLLFAS